VSWHPAPPATSLGETTVAEQAVLNALVGRLEVGIAYPPPKTTRCPRAGAVTGPPASSLNRAP
jgi:phospholipase C